MATRIHWNRKLRAELTRSPAVQALLDQAAEQIKTGSERESPISLTGGGDYIHRFVIRKHPTSRRVANTDPFAHLVEWGSINNPPYAPLRRGVIAAGYRLAEDYGADYGGLQDANPGADFGVPYL